LYINTLLNICFVFYFLLYRKTFLSILEFVSTFRKDIYQWQDVVVNHSVLFLKPNCMRYLIDKLIQMWLHHRFSGSHTHMSFTGEKHDWIVNQIARRVRPVRWAKVLPILFRFSPRSPKKRVVQSVGTVHRCRWLPRGPPSVSLLQKGAPVVLNLAARLIWLANER